MSTESSKARRIRFGAIAATLAVAITCGYLAIGNTNADFSDTHSGTITGTVGSIRLQTTGGSGADSMDFQWNNMLPDQWNSATITYENVGANVEDVLAKFDSNPTALSALNDLGHYGAAQVYGGADGSTLLFNSTNLSDHSSCPVSPQTDCKPLPGTITLLSGLQPGATASFTVKFMYTSKLTQQAPAGTTVPFNAYPATDGQTTVRSQDGTGSGLPIQLVGMQQH